MGTPLHMLAFCLIFPLATKDMVTNKSQLQHQSCLEFLIPSVSPMGLFSKDGRWTGRNQAFPWAPVIMDAAKNDSVHWRAPNTQAKSRSGLEADGAVLSL